MSVYLFGFACGMLVEMILDYVAAWKGKNKP